MRLEEIIQGLYRNEISCGIETGWDNGITAWIGDSHNGRVRTQSNFPIDEIDKVGEWLDLIARQEYPNSDYARNTPVNIDHAFSMTIPVTF